MAGPLILGTKHDNAAPGASTDIFASAIVPPPGTAKLRVTIILGTANAVLSVTISDGTNTRTGTFNSGSALTTGRLLTFDAECVPSWSYNFQLDSGTATVAHMIVKGISNETA